jgi:hypothetical protein
MRFSICHSHLLGSCRVLTIGCTSVTVKVTNVYRVVQPQGLSHWSRYRGSKMYSLPLYSMHSIHSSLWDWCLDPKAVPLPKSAFVIGGLR